MRIEKLRFRNINSLAGEWVVDFTDPKLAESGIFLITGPTGSGKTTILDAISLALYARTPRTAEKGKTTAQGDTVMTEGTGECLSEVTYSTDEGRYRVQWEQHRAYLRPDGHLRDPVWEFSQLNAGGPDTPQSTPVIERTKNQVQLLVETTTGMDFDQFTRSVLLAQGNFSKFLDADARDRAPILEQITKVDIYTRVSKAVYERYSAEETKLKDLRLRQGGVSTLEAEQRAGIERTKAELVEGIKKASDRHALLVTQAAWHDETRRGTEARRAAKERLSAAVTQEKMFREEERGAEKLEADARAAALDTILARLADKRAESERVMKEFSSARARLPGLREARDKAVVTADRASRVRKWLETRMRDWLRPHFAKVRDLDTQIYTLSQVERKAQDTLSGEKGKVAGSARALLEKRRALRAAERERDALREWLKTSARDATLPGQFSGITTVLADLKEKEAAVTAASEKERQALSDRDSAISAYEKAAASHTKLVAQQAAREETARLSVSELEEALGGDTFDALNTRRALLGQVQGEAQALVEAIDQLSITEDTLGNLRKELTAREGELATATASLTAADDRISCGEQRLSVLHERLLEAQRSASFEQARASLREGSPCPCCGSTHHPWASGGSPSQDEHRKAYEAATAALDREKAARPTLMEKKNEIAVAKGRVEGIITSVTSLCATNKAAVRKARDTMVARAGDADLAGLLELPAAATWPDAGSPGLIDTARAALAQAENATKALDERADRARPLAARLARLEEEAQDLATRVITSSAEKRVAETNKQNAENAFREKKREREERSGARDTVRDAVAGRIGTYGFPAEALRDPDRLERDLRTRLTQWEKTSAAFSSANNAIEKINGEIKALREVAKGYRANEKSLLNQAKKYQDDLAALGERRRKLFRERDVNKVSACAEAKLDHAKKNEELASAEQLKATVAFDKERDRVSSLASDLIARRREIATCEERELRSALQAQGFASEAVVAEARLDKATRDALRVRSDAITARLQEAQAALDEADKALEALRADTARATTVPELDIIQQRDTLAQFISDNTRQLGALSQQLEADDENRRRLGELQTMIDAQEAVTLRWQRLNGLIGSADGQKFSRFAQGLTLTILVNLANRELKTLMDRYRLVMCTAQDKELEFNVIDTWMGNEARETINLSGGEKFIVSLALALALSVLSRGRTRIDTMFMDEGFGTLDDDLREQTVTTLAGMRHDGGLVGIISHMSSLREHIPTQIRINKNTDGRSTLSSINCDCVRRGDYAPAPGTRRMKKSRKTKY